MLTSQTQILVLYGKCSEVLREWNLNVNAGNTEFVRFYLAGKDDLDDDGVALRGNEPWRVSKSLESLLC